MLSRVPLPRLFAVAAVVTMILAAGAVWKLAGSYAEMLETLAPAWIGIAAVFWVLWRQVAPETGTREDLPPRPLTTDFGPLLLDRRYADLSELSLSSLDYVVVDTETTGLKPETDAIVQIGAVRIADGRLVTNETFERLVAPGRRIPAGATRFHGLTDADVAGAPGIEEVMAAFADFAGNAVLVGHNIAFDLAFMNRTRRLDNAVLDTMLLSIGAFPDRRGHTLDDLAKSYGEEVRGRHTASGDAELTARLLLRLIPDLGRVGVRNFGDAQAMCEDAAQRIKGMRTRG